MKIPILSISLWFFEEGLFWAEDEKKGQGLGKLSDWKIGGLERLIRNLKFR